MWWLIIILILVLFLYSHKRLSYFSSRGIQTFPPPLPFLGNLTAVTFGRENFVEAIAAGYNKFKDQRYFGFYQYMVPALVLKDPELIRQTMVRDFNCFIDRGVHIGTDCDPFFGRNIVMLTGSRWRTMRAAITPAFSGVRCRYMAPLMAERAKAVADYLRTHITSKKIMDVNEITMPYVNDVIASCAFGFAVDSHKDPENCIYKLGIKAIVQDTTQIMKMYGFENMKFIMKMLNVRIIPTEVTDQFSQLFKSALKARREKLVQPRPDFIQTLVDVAEEITDDDLVAQAVLFYIAGYDTTTNLINYFLYEMAINPEVQEKLYEELNKVPGDDKIENIYETVQGLKYLEMCVCEVLRLWPLVASAGRRSVSTYDFGPMHPGSKHNLVAPAGIHIWLSIYSIHRDEKYWPNPNTCDPERFAPDKRGNITPYTYLPFGTGPRHCIGSRFALLTAKIFLMNFLRVYKTSAFQKSSRLCPRAFILRPADGYNLIVEPRTL
ncbi:hypothetical protein K1T71_007469 [Dendrolimus kikuchii]|uniref:Uncharacterized protein n=1 Tax=Dendrolimus kikuchii TaxID=765133 RepID=A0ACC1D0W0_9NEOP|nr:hypothetical protein K1T71_007469 [Dendrolimus kikuchii]